MSSSQFQSSDLYCSLKFERFHDDIIKRMVRKAQVRSVLRTSQCQLQERVRKHEGLQGIQIPMSSSHEVLRSNTQKYSVFFYSNFCPKHLFLSFVFFEIFARFEINRARCMYDYTLTLYNFTLDSPVS